LSELVARLRALIRRSYGGDSPTIAIGGVTIDSAARRVYRDGVEVELTAREYAILEHLVRSRGRIVTRNMLYEHLYSEDEAVGSNVVEVHIASLRRKLGADVIRTRRGEGYLIDA
jgi:DNA-binding response OmpR family regulator